MTETWEIVFILPARKKRIFFQKSVEFFKGNYTPDNPLLVRDETIGSLEEETDREGKIPGVSQQADLLVSRQLVSVANHKVGLEKF